MRPMSFSNGLPTAVTKAESSQAFNGVAFGRSIAPGCLELLSQNYQSFGFPNVVFAWKRCFWLGCQGALVQVSPLQIQALEQSLGLSVHTQTSSALPGNPRQKFHLLWK